MHLNPEYDRCYCVRCYKEEWPNTVSNEGPSPYVIPRGWVRFGLALPPRALSSNLDIFNKWSVSFHGVKSEAVLASILDHGGLRKPGDELLDGNVLRSKKCAGRQDEVQCAYSSPTACTCDSCLLGVLQTCAHVAWCTE